MSEVDQQPRPVPTDLGSLPAYPIPIAGTPEGSIYNAVQQSSGLYGGLTKRELFAAMIAQGIAATWDGHIAEMAARSVVVADALLKELAK